MYTVTWCKKYYNKYENGEVKEVIAFDLQDVSTGSRYNKLRLHTLEDGQLFIAFPSYESTGTGKFYNYFFLKFTQDEENDILKQLKEKTV